MAHRCQHLADRQERPHENPENPRGTRPPQEAAPLPLRGSGACSVEKSAYRCKNTLPPVNGTESSVTSRAKLNGSVQALSWVAAVPAFQARGDAVAGQATGMLPPHSGKQGTAGRVGPRATRLWNIPGPELVADRLIRHSEPQRAAQAGAQSPQPDNVRDPRDPRRAMCSIKSTRSRGYPRLFLQHAASVYARNVQMGFRFPWWEIEISLSGKATDHCFSLRAGHAQMCRPLTVLLFVGKIMVLSILSNKPM